MDTMRHRWKVLLQSTVEDDETDCDAEDTLEYPTAPARKLCLGTREMTLCQH
jgi:hypothetical protein